MLFDQLFTQESGWGYPGHRKDSQARSRSLISDVSGATHRTMAEIIRCLPDEIVRPAFGYPGMAELLLAQPPSALESAIRGRLS
jgi:hypothetical protein